MNQQLALDVQDLGYSYRTGRLETPVLTGVDLMVEQGEFVAIMGPSGSGKSTLLNCIAGLDTPQNGRIAVSGVAIHELDETDRTLFRREQIGFVYQDYGLIESLDARANIELPMRMSRRVMDPHWLNQLAHATGIVHYLARRPAQLSGGQQQRVAITRALMTRPKLVIADEPTGALDTRTSAAVLTLLRECVDDLGQTIVMVTHDPVAASYSDSVILLVDGHVEDRIKAPRAETIAEHLAKLEAATDP